MRLSPAQHHALTIMHDRNIRYTVRGGRPFTNVPYGVRVTTLNALYRKGLVNCTHSGVSEITWWITPQGDAAIEFIRPPKITGGE